jgi:hypothetical protein
VADISAVGNAFLLKIRIQNVVIQRNALIFKGSRNGLFIQRFRIDNRRSSRHQAPDGVLPEFVIKWHIADITVKTSMFKPV